jgi:peptide/nickel transport system permease protein
MPGIAAAARILVRQTARLTLHLLCLAVGLFLLTRLLGGDPVRASLGPTAPAELVAQRRAELHLDQPVVKQLGLYLQDLAHLDLGRSIASGQPIGEKLTPRIANSVELGLAALPLVALGATLGVAAAALTRNGRRRMLERLFAGGTGFFTAVPEFLLAAALIYGFAITLRWFPTAGHTDWRSLILPALALGLGPAALLARVTHVETRRVLAERYILTARSKHLPPALLYGRHVLPNLLSAALGVGGMIAASLLGGAVLVENVFAWPGLGSGLVAAITVRDYPIVQAIGLLLGSLVMILNTLVDIALAALHGVEGRG